MEQEDIRMGQSNYQKFLKCNREIMFLDSRVGELGQGIGFWDTIVKIYINI